MAELNVYQRLKLVQQEAVAPREISGKFGKGRSAEQILEAYKPICNKHGLFLNTTDSISQVGDRNYITATAYVTNVDKPQEQHFASAIAWEGEVPLSNSGGAILDTSQVSGKTSSYAKKYALQNLFAIDDTKDADIADITNQVTAPVKTFPSTAPTSEKAKEYLESLKHQISGNFNTAGLNEAEEQLKFIEDLIGKRTIDTIDEAKEVLNEAQSLNVSEAELASMTP